jgi:hypothetical protein
MSDEQKSDERDELADDESVSMARRRLLRIGAYTAPVVLATLAMSRNASAVLSCTPRCGPPCGPPCSPPCAP